MKKLIFAMTVILLTLSLCACTGNGEAIETGGTDTEAAIETIVETIAETTTETTSTITTVLAEETTAAESEIADFPIDNINMPDGISTPKTDAIGYDGRFLKFDFAFVRDTEDFYRDSRLYPDEFDFSEFIYSGAKLGNVKPVYTRLSAGDTYGDLTVKKATSLVYSINVKSESGELYKDIEFKTCEVDFKGTVKLKGLLYCAPADDYILERGGILFFPYSNEAQLSLAPYDSPDIVSPLRWFDETGSFAMYGDISKIYLGNIDTIDLDLTSYFDDSNYLPVEITLKDPVVLCSEDTGGNRSYGTLTDFEFLD